jgi:hypothetical protein
LLSYLIRRDDDTEKTNPHPDPLYLGEISSNTFAP